MKFKIRFQKRTNVYITLFACGVSLWMMVTRFGLPVNDLLKFLWITLFSLGAVIVFALIISGIWVLANRFKNRD